MFLEFDNQRKWYAFYCKSRAEKRAFEVLYQQGYVVLLPLITRIRHWSDRKKKVKKPLIPGYVFVNCNYEETFKIARLKHIVALVKIGTEPGVLRDSEVNLLKKITEFGLKADLFRNGFHRGQKVAIINGPLNGYEGIVHNEDSNKEICIFIEGIQQEIRVKIDSLDLKCIEKACK